MQTTCSCTLRLGRRPFIAGTVALAATRARAEDAPHRIDVHHHIVPPSWLAALKQAKLDNPPLSSWTPQRSIEDMDAGRNRHRRHLADCATSRLPARGRRRPHCARGQ